MLTLPQEKILRCIYILQIIFECNATYATKPTQPGENFYQRRTKDYYMNSGDYLTD
jgi:hypothetical protein